MQKRIRYIRENNNSVNIVYKTRKPILCGTIFCDVYLYPKTLTFIIREVNSERQMSTGTGINTHSIKINAKEALKQMGAKFDDEVRAKKNGEPRVIGFVDQTHEMSEYCDLGSNDTLEDILT